MCMLVQLYFKKKVIDKSSTITSAGKTVSWNVFNSYI